MLLYPDKKLLQPHEQQKKVPRRDRVSINNLLFIFLVAKYLFILLNKIEQKSQNPLIGIILGVLLKMYIAMIGLSAIKQLITLYLNQRQQKHRQYQIIFGLSTRCHTLSNLLYMGLYMSFFLLPFYFIINYYGFKFHYIGMFAAFVISSLTSTLMLTSFFTDHKIAAQIIGILFSLSSFLPLLYSGGQTNQDGEIVYTAVDYLGMFIPNSSFSIAIMYDNPRASFLSVSIVKIYLIVYSFMQFPHQYYELFQSCKSKFSKCLKINHNTDNQNILTQQLNINDQISQNSSSSQNQQQMSQNTMIKITNLVKKYKIKQGQFNALNNINLTIKKRQIFGLLGRNGAGKTTLVDILTDVVGPTGGKYSINYQKSQNQDVQKIGICYQHEILYEQLTVQTHLYFYARIKNIQANLTQTIDDIVNMLGIKDQFKKKVKQLSGGNKRKVSVAIALLGNPQLMIFDQPTSGLDPLSRRSVWQILQKLKLNYNSSIILTTHHLDEAEVLSDLICVIQKGNILVQNTPDQIKSKYGKGYYLTIQFKNKQVEQQKQKFIIQYLQNSLQKVQLLQTQNNITKLFLKFPLFVKKGQVNEGRAMSQEQEERLLLSLLQWLDKIQDIKIDIEKNSLEQSFIAILKDPQNGLGNGSSGDMELSNKAARPIHPRKSIEQYQNQTYLQKLRTLMRQVLGIFLRCFYFHKGMSLKFFLIYNINILMFIFALFFNKFILKVMQEGSEQIKSTEANPLQNQGQNQKYQNSMLILQGYILMASAFMSLPIYQKQKNIRRVFNSRGVSPLAYWFGTFLFDYGCYLVNLIVLSQFVTPQSFQPFAKANSATHGLWPFITLGVGVIIYTYTISNIFQKATTANTGFSIFNMLFGFILLPVIILGQSTFLGYFSFVKYFYPYYDLNYFLMKSTLQTSGGQLMKDMIMKGSSASGQKQYIYYTIVFYLVVLILIEMRIWDRIKQFWNKDEVQQNQKNIQLKNVSKSYEGGTIQAMNNVSYYVGDQRLALLGHNGAGKSTTFSLLSGQINPSSGTLFLQNKTKLNHQKIMNSSGICYQQNCLWQNMTPLQILNIFTYLVPINNSGKQIQWILESLQFQSMNFNKRFENLSGGNKRKICMAVALFGDPIVRLLDQCSTGLDPSSRVAMVQTIKYSPSGSTIYTTHSMPEAQSLCSKTVIMKKGEVLQFDYIYKLKQKYYNCFWIDVVFKANKKEENVIYNMYEGGSNNAATQQDIFIQKNIDRILQQLREIVLQIDRRQRIFRKTGSPLLRQQKQQTIEDHLPLILKTPKQIKMRIQFQKQVWSIHLALMTVYELRNRLQKYLNNNSQQSLIENIYISQPKLQDIYIRLTKNDHDENGDNDNMIAQPVTAPSAGIQQLHYYSYKGQKQINPQRNYNITRPNNKNEIQLVQFQ